MTLAWSTRSSILRADRQDDAISRAVLPAQRRHLTVPDGAAPRCGLLDDTGWCGHRAAAEQHGEADEPMTPVDGAHHLVIAFISTGAAQPPPSRR